MPSPELPPGDDLSPALPVDLGPQPLPYDGPAIDNPMTATNCAIFGVKLFIGCFAVAWAIALAPRAAKFDDAIWKIVGREIFATVSMAGVLGAVLGFEAYRLAAGARKPSKVGCFLWGVLTLCVCFFHALMIYLQIKRRDSEIVDGNPPHLLLPVLYALLVLGFSLLGDGYFGAISSFLPYFCDCILVSVIAKKRRERALATPNLKRIQFSLGALLLMVWGLAAWVAVAVVLFR